MKSGIAFLLATLVLSSPGSAQQSVSLDTVQFQIRDNAIVLGVSVNGLPRKFILDTGATHTAIDTKTARELQLPRLAKGIEVVRGGKITCAFTQLDSIGVGRIRLHDFSCAVIDVGDFLEPYHGEDVLGVLGFDFLSKFQVDIDYCSKRIIIRRCAPEPGKPSCEGDSAVVPGFGTIRAPNNRWGCVVNPTRPVVVAFETTKASKASGVFEVLDLGVTGVISVAAEARRSEREMPSYIEDFEKVSGEETTLGGNEAYVLEYFGKIEGCDIRLRNTFVSVKDALYLIICSAPVTDFGALRLDFEQFVNSIQLEK